MKERRRGLAWGSVAGWVVVLLVLGGATSIGLTWALAFTRPGPVGKDYESFGGQVEGGHFSISVGTLESWWQSARSWKFTGGGTDASGRFTRGSDELRRRFAAALEGVLPAKHRGWLADRDARASGSVSDGGEVWEIHAGWPWRCVATTYGTLDPIRNPPPYGYEGAIHFKTSVLSGWRGYDDVVLAYRPLWGGLVPDTLVFGAGWFVVLLAAGAARRRWRRRHGLCPACGYDLGGEFGGGCSECGWGRESGAREAESGKPE